MRGEPNAKPAVLNAMNKPSSLSYDAKPNKSLVIRGITIVSNGNAKVSRIAEIAAHAMPKVELSMNANRINVMTVSRWQINIIGRRPNRS